MMPPNIARRQSAMMHRSWPAAKFGPALFITGRQARHRRHVLVVISDLKPFSA
jgi:hypothetical protein